MGICRPYPRVYLPFHNGRIPDGLINDKRYINKEERSSLLNAARIILYDFQHLLDYIEPVDVNKKVFSHRVYELLLRTATEFEANCKGILLANGFEKKKGHFNIKDYYKINQLMKLDQYVVTTHLWNPAKTFRPLEEWGTGHSLKWYQAYNNAKHNRLVNFHEANLENLFNGICSLVVLLVAQFNTSVSLMSANGISIPINDGEEIFVSFFNIKLPHFDDSEKYDFDYDAIENDGRDFDKYFIDGKYLK